MRVHTGISQIVHHLDMYVHKEISSTTYYHAVYIICRSKVIKSLIPRLPDLFNICTRKEGEPGMRNHVRRVMND